jgi:hypothetical protein
MTETEGEAMSAIEKTLGALAGPPRDTDARELAHRRAALEADLETMVRCALRNGTGLPRLVRWVRGALPGVSAASPGEPAAQRAAPVLARLLCRTLIGHFRPPRCDPGTDPFPTVVGR